MARAKKNTAPVEAEITEEPAAGGGCDPSTMDITDEQAAAMLDQASTLQWPENTERRDLPFDYDNEALAGMAKLMGGIITEREETKGRAKRAAASFKAEIDELDARLDAFATDIATGKGTQSVLCRWHYETSGQSAEGGFIYHPEMKTLVREDTGEVVTIAPITPEERQMEMTLGGKPEEWTAPEGNEPLGLPGPGESEADAAEPQLEEA